MEPERKKRSNFFAVAILVLLSFGLGFWIGEYQVVCEVCPPQDINFSLFWEAYRKLEEKFVDKAKLNSQNIIYGAISGMVESLDDPYTVFLNPEDSKRFEEDVQGVFEGVGMEIGVRNGQLQVIAPIEGTPAQKAGLLPGDEILKIDGTSTADLTVDEAVTLIRGQKGTQVILTIFREGWGESRDFTITRGVIEIPSVQWKMIEDGGEQIAYVQLYQFSGKAGFEFTKAALEISNSPSHMIILDLRNNPGGYLEIAQEIAGWFLEKGEVVVIEDFGGGVTKNYLSEGNGRFSDYKVVILINEGSASGSEILAGALRDDRGVLLIGESSFGKGSVQELESLRDGSSLKITVAKWLTPSGDLITDKGLEPDIKVDRTMEDYEAGKDPQLDKAIEVIKEL